MAFTRGLEAKTVRKMIAMYCNDTHVVDKNQLCADCTELYEYAKQRIDRCPFGDDKPVCSKCTVHCYKPEMRDRIKTVMQYSGPKMIFKSPLLSVRYMYRKTFKSGLQMPKSRNENPRRNS